MILLDENTKKIRGFQLWITHQLQHLLQKGYCCFCVFFIRWVWLLTVRFSGKSSEGFFMVAQQQKFATGVSQLYDGAALCCLMELHYVTSLKYSGRGNSPVTVTCSGAASACKLLQVLLAGVGSLPIHHPHLQKRQDLNICLETMSEIFRFIW